MLFCLLEVTKPGSLDLRTVRNIFESLHHSLLGRQQMILNQTVSVGQGTNCAAASVQVYTTLHVKHTFRLELCFISQIYCKYIRKGTGSPSHSVCYLYQQNNTIYYTVNTQIKVTFVRE